MVQLIESDILTKEVLDWKGLHLFHFWGSSCSQKARIFLRLKGADWTSHALSLPKSENLTPYYLGINPRGLVPCLIDDGAVHIESNDIILYLEDRLDGPPLVPEDAREDIASFLKHEDDLHMDLRTLTFRYTRMPGPVGKSAEALEVYRNAGSGQVAGRRDVARAREIAFWEAAATHGLPDDAVRASAEAFRAALGGLDLRLAAGSYLLGEALSILDIAWFIYVLRLKRCGYPVAVLHPRVAEWSERLCARDDFSRETTLLPEMAAVADESQRLQRAQGVALDQLMGVSA